MWTPSSSAVVSDRGTVTTSELCPRVVGYQLSVLSPEEIERMKAKDITEHQVYFKNLPRLDGPNDPALGPSDRRVRCSTCRNNWFKCPGHIGVIHLAVPLYHVGWVDSVFKILQMTCWVCAELLGDADDPGHLKQPNARGIVKFAAQFVRGKGRFTCHSCKVRQPKYARAGMVITRSWKPEYLAIVDAMGLGEEARRPFTPTDALELLRNISDDNIRRLGMDPVLSHPAWLIHQNLAVLPPNARPAIMASEGSKRRGQDDITNQMQDIIKTNRTVRKRILQASLNIPVRNKGTKAAMEAASAANQAASTRAFNEAREALAATAPLSSAAAAALGPTSTNISGADGFGTAKGGAAGAPTFAGLGPVNATTMATGAAAKRATAGAPGVGNSGKVTMDTLLLEHRHAEFMVATGYPGDFTEEEAVALRFALPDAVLTLSPSQSAAVWTKYPMECERLQNEVAVLYDNNGRFAPQARQRTGVAKRTLHQRLSGKTGRMRANNMAKRADQNARSVVRPDKCLDVDELGVPQSFMNTLTKPEVVTQRTLQWLQAAVAAGPGVTGGAARVLHVSGELTQLHLMDAEARAALRLQYGDVVERHLVNGDLGCFNRQPSLHRLSFMAHKLVGVPGEAFCVSLAAVSPYNADFDGDEMNLHVLQDLASDAEALTLMSVSCNVMNPQNNAPCLSLVQDARVGAMLLTRRSTKLSLDQMHQCVGAMRYPLPGKEHIPPPSGTFTDEDCRRVRGRVRGEPYWTGKQLVSMMLPPGIFLERRVRGAGPHVGPDDPLERYVLIENGVLVHGTLCKATVGQGAGGIVHRILTMHGPDAVIRFLSDFQRVVYEWLPTHGLTMGLRDCMVSTATRDAIRSMSAYADRVVEELTSEAEALSPHMTSFEAARLEDNILTILTSVLDYASKLVLGDAGDDALAGVGDPDAAFSFRAMVAAASKGSAQNPPQVAAALGQQVVEGERVRPLAHSRRTLAMFPAGALSAAARGFIAHSYLGGMRPYEYFFHMQAGREGLVATAVQTADTGYKYRSMEKAAETNVLCWDGSVRNAQGYIIEFIAGGDYMSSTSVERVDVPALKWGDAAVLAACAGYSAATLQRVFTLRDELRSGLLTLLYPELATRLLLPLNVHDEVKRAAWEVSHADARAVRFADDADFERVSVAALEEEVLRLVDDVAACVPSREAVAALEFVLLVELRPARLEELGLGSSLRPLRHVLRPDILRRVRMAVAQPGESLGVIASQSIGEPSTQFTLNAFHQAGLMQRRMTVGVPRLKELLHATPKIHTPSMLIPFRDGSLDRPTRDRLAASLQFLCLDNVLLTSYVQLDPSGGDAGPPTTLFKDRDLMAHTVAMYGPERGVVALSPWVVRMVFNRTLLAEHGYTPEKVALAIAKQMAHTQHRLLVVYAQPNMAQWVLRVRIDGDVSERAARDLHAELRDTILLGGTDGIRHSRVIPVTRSQADDATGEIVKCDELVVDTEGSALMKIATRDWADWERTVTNDVQEVARTLGLVATRALLFAELDRVISYDGGYVDARHIRQVVNTMTHRGYVMPLTRFGINRVDFSFIQRASYEEPVDMMLQAAMTSELDPLHGMCECIMFGQLPPVGTGTVAVRHDIATPGTHAPPRVTVSSREQDLLRGNRKQFRSNRRVEQQQLSLQQPDAAADGAALAAQAPSARRGQTSKGVPVRSTALVTIAANGIAIAQVKRAVVSCASAPAAAESLAGASRSSAGDAAAPTFRPSSPTQDVLAFFREKRQSIAGGGRA